MNELTIKKTLGCRDKTQTFVINAKKSDTKRKVKIQIVDDLALFDMIDVKSAIMYYKVYDKKTKSIDLSPTLNVLDSSVTFCLCDLVDVDGLVICEIVLKDNKDKDILTTNTFYIKVHNLGGDCY